MTNIQTNLIDNDAEQTLADFLTNVISATNPHLTIDRIISRQISTLSDVPNDMLIRCYKLSLDRAYQSRLINHLTKVLPSTDSQEIHKTPQALAYSLANLATGKISNEANAAIYSEIEGAISDRSLVGLQKGVFNSETQHPLLN